MALLEKKSVIGRNVCITDGDLTWEVPMEKSVRAPQTDKHVITGQPQPSPHVPTCHSRDQFSEQVCLPGTFASG